MLASTFPSVRALAVLVVDDERDAAESLAELISLHGHETRAAYSGDEAVQVASAFRPDVVFTDLAMPHMDGFGLARWLRAQVPDALLVAVTGLTDPALATDCKGVGFDHVLAKPIHLHSLEGILLRASVRRKVTRGWGSSNG